jgi:hypothetical protein
MGTSGYLHGVKGPEREADHSPPSSAEVECVELYLHSPSTPSWRDSWFRITFCAVCFFSSKPWKNINCGKFKAQYHKYLVVLETAPEKICLMNSPDAWERKEICIQFWSENLKGKRHLAGPSHEWAYNIKMDLREIAW